MSLENILQHYLYPVYSNMTNRPYFVIINAFLLVCAVYMAANLYTHFRTRKHTDIDTLEKPDSSGKFVGAAIIASLMFLSIFTDMDRQGTAISTFGVSITVLLQAIVTILDPLLNISKLSSHPFPDIWGLNLIYRICIICILAAAILASGGVAKRLCLYYLRFLNHKIFSTEQEVSLKEEDPGDPPKEESVIAELVSKLLQFAGSGGLLIFLAYIFGSQDTQDNISEVLTAITKIIETATLLSEVGQTDAGFFSRFLYIVLSFFIMTVYVIIGIMLIFLVQIMWKKRGDISNWIERRRKPLWIAAGAVLLASAVFAAITILGHELQNSGFLQKDFSNTPQVLFRFTAYFALAFLGAAVVLLLLTLMAAFVVLTVAYAITIVKSTIARWTEECQENDANKAAHHWNIAKIVAGTVGGGLMLLVLAFGYVPLCTWLVSLFDAETAVILPVDMFRLLATLLALFELGLLLTAIALVLSYIIVGGAINFFTEKRFSVVNEVSRLIKNVLTAVIHFVDVLPFLVKHVCEVFKHLVVTLLQIFTGYRNESEKNNAIFVAACFASLASLLNTYLGLNSFYHSRSGNDASLGSSWIPSVCSFAISCAVQLAMLICGMKAGEGLAEWSLMQQRVSKNRGARAIATKGLLLAGLFIVDISLLLSFLYSIFPGNDDTSNENALRLPTMLILFGLAFFTYAIILQVMDLIALLKERKAAKKKQMASEENPASEGLSENTAATAPTSLAAPVHGQPEPRRIPYRWYLAVYLLLMIVSTGFAFNNLFGYYANQQQIRLNVYDQIRDETVKQLQLSETATSLTQEYTANIRDISDKFTKRANDASKVKEEKENLLRTAWDESLESQREENGPDDEVNYTEQNTLSRFLNEVLAFDETVSVIKEFLEADYNIIGRKTVAVEECYYYWGYAKDPSYQTMCVLIYNDNEQDQGIGGTNTGANAGQNASTGSPARPNATIVGPYVPEEHITEVTVEGRQVTVPNTRLKDPSSDAYSVEKTTREIQNMDQYAILKQLFILYERLESSIYDEVVESKEGSGSRNDGNTVSKEIYPVLDRNAELMDIYTSAAALCNEIEGPSKTEADVSNGATQEQADLWSQTSISGLTVMVNQYLTGIKGNTDLSYESLSEYIDRALALDSILAGFYRGDASDETANDENEVDNKDSNVDTAQTETDTPAYRVRKYRNYARVISNSDFQISYDTLFKGEWGLNPVRDKINALYSSFVVALFLLIICALIDFLAFFSGLLIFKDVYLFEQNSRIRQIGYLQYETELTQLFTFSKESPERILYLAFIYDLLYGNATGESGGDLNTRNDTSGDTTPVTTPQEEEDSNTSSEQQNGAAGANDSTATPPEEEDGGINPDRQDGTTSTNDSTAIPREDGDGDTNPEQQDGTAGTNDLAAASQESKGQFSPQQPDEKGGETISYDRMNMFYQDLETIHNVMRTQDYQVFREKMQKALAELGIQSDTQGNCGPFLLWLRSFVQTSGIKLKPLVFHNNKKGKSSRR